MLEALIYAKRNGFDVFNATNDMENATVFDDLKFKPGDGTLHYYLHTQRCPTIEPDQLAFSLPTFGVGLN